ncbi:MAG: hypothetical protein Q9174_001194 [Haloplaca sp. 1 TL-2023]
MGAVHKLDLTSDVTHLIVGDADTPKYKFVAKERPDVQCLLPTWVEALRELWMAGGEPDVKALEIQHRLPTLHNLRVCVTGFEDMAFRKKIEEDVNKNGGEYRANLTKDVTHLIAKEPSGAKYTYATDWKIKIVAVEWLDQTLERGMILDENLYSLLLAPTERGRNAWNRRVSSTSSLGKRSFDGDTTSSGPRKLRRTASTRLASQNNGFWDTIVNNEIKNEPPTYDQSSKQRQAAKGGSESTSSSKSEHAAILKEQPDPLPFPAKIGAVALPTPIRPITDVAPRRGIFAGKKLVLDGFNEKKTVHQPTVVTDMWVERTLHRKQYIRPDANVTNTPFRTFPISGFERLVVCSTGFEGVDLLHMSKSVKLMGATYNEEFSPKASVLICNKVITGHEKLRHARHWNIPAVTTQWLWDCIDAGESKSYDSFLAQPYPSKPLPEAGASREKSLGPDKEDIRKGKVVETETDSSIKGEDPGTRFSKELPFNLGSGELIDHGATSPQKKTESISLLKRSEDLPPPQAIFSGPEPLREITPNSSPPKAIPFTSPSKPATTNTIAKSPSKSAPYSITSALTSFLANARSGATNENSNSYGPGQPRNNIRRKRQLFGRAPSNASNLSRASSVDTVNTDGVGTPLEPVRSASTNDKTNGNITMVGTGDSAFDPLATYTDEPIVANEDEQLQLTQLGYEDPDALAWRETVERKLGGGITVKKEEGRVRMKEIGKVKDLTGKGAGAVGKRTRQAMGK